MDKNNKKVAVAERKKSIGSKGKEGDIIINAAAENIIPADITLKEKNK